MKWTVFAYEPDLYGNVYFGLQQGDLLSAKAYSSIIVAEMISTAWNDDHDKLVEFAEGYAALQGFAQYILSETDNAIKEHGFKPLEDMDSDNTKIDIHVFVSELQKARKYEETKTRA